MTAPNRSASKARTNTIIYWVLISLFTIAMTMDGLAGLLREQTDLQVMHQLGYPVYLLTIVGASKLLGIVALLQPWYQAAKEWAYAGFAINFVGAMASWAFVSTDYTTVVPPLIMLAYLAALYIVQKRYENR